MKVGDRIEIKMTGEQGVLRKVNRMGPSFEIALDDGREVVIFNPMEIRKAEDPKRKEELLKKVRKGAADGKQAKKGEGEEASGEGN